MPKYIIERHIPGAAQLSQRDLQAIAMKSNRVLSDLGPSIQWMHSYVTGDRLYCVYIAPDPNMIREHAKRGEFPVNEIMEIKTVIDPVTAEG